MARCFLKSPEVPFSATLAHVGSGGRQVGRRGVTGLPLLHSHPRAASPWSHGGPRGGKVTVQPRPGSGRGALGPGWRARALSLAGGQNRGPSFFAGQCSLLLFSTRLLSETSTQLPGTCLDPGHGEAAPGLPWPHACCPWRRAQCSPSVLGGRSAGSDSGPRCLSGRALCSPSLRPGPRTAEASGCVGSFHVGNLYLPQ